MQADEEGMTHTLVPSKGSHQVFLDVQAGSTLAWAFEVGSCDYHSFSCDAKLSERSLRVVCNIS